MLALTPPRPNRLLAFAASHDGRLPLPLLPSGQGLQRSLQKTNCMSKTCWWRGVAVAGDIEWLALHGLGLLTGQANVNCSNSRHNAHAVCLVSAAVLLLAFTSLVSLVLGRIFPCVDTTYVSASDDACRIVAHILPVLFFAQLCRRTRNILRAAPKYRSVLQHCRHGVRHQSTAETWARK